ncbi:MAG: bifunctional 3-deoxy-7-phosphoheptulonate synthase/chorismate mutase type II [Bdellovibrionales bacterium]|nr:bifunctional 3-deoxy-7-phosphoheptulonate synthase/chorismate mutase type II [Bdellovibrionales bacterium]MBT3525719.1 bifunctional 3-deoxy-7-phosphoheptulonate synthase/chorismate mutase type II [Bdellovibrionales bacterium]
MQIQPLTKWIDYDKQQGPLVIAGPCSAESLDQLLITGQSLKKSGQVSMLRAGVWKPRTRPNCFEGLGPDALPWLDHLRQVTGLPICVEVGSPGHVEAALSAKIDVLWIGARTTTNPFLVQDIANSLKGVDIPVMVKNPINPQLALWLGALERMEQAGITKLAAIHRGFSLFDGGPLRNPPLWRIPIELKRLIPKLPIICDPSHICGSRTKIEEICQQALDLGMDGLMIESHHNPDQALSDRNQQLTPAKLNSMLKRLITKREYTDDQQFDSKLEDLRNKIDHLDREIIELLHRRMEVVSKIGDAKIKKRVTVLQLHRLEDLMRKRREIADQVGLNPDFASELYTLIHEESVRVQTGLAHTPTVQ